MTLYTVKAYVNVGEDNFHGLKPRDPIALVDEFAISDESPECAAHTMWIIGNRMGDDIGYVGKPYPRDVRSLSVGDLISVKDDRSMTFFAVDRADFTVIPEPANPIVELAGSKATSRPAGITP